MASIEDIKALADLQYAAQTTGVSSALLNSATAAVGIDTSDPFSYMEVQELLESYGYTPGSGSGFYANATTGQTQPDDAGLAIHYNAVETAVNEYGYLESTEANMAEYGGKIDPTTGELYKFMVNDNLANAVLITDGLAAQGADVSSTVASTTSSVDEAQVTAKYTEEYDRQNKLFGGDLDNSLQWANIDRIKSTDTGTAGTGAVGLTGTGTTDTGAGGVSGGFTADAETLDIPDSAVLPTFANGVSQVSPGASGTYTVPAQTFEDNITNQVESFKTRAAEQDFTTPQTIQEKQISLEHRG